MLKKLTVLLTFVVFIFSMPAFAQFSKVDKLDLPADYQQWPNKLEKEKKLDEKNTLTVAYFARGHKDSRVADFIQVIKINNEIVAVIYFKDEDPYAHGIVGTVEIFGLADQGYLKLNLNREYFEQAQAKTEKLDERVAEELVLWEERIEEKFGIEDFAGRIAEFNKTFGPEISDFFDTMNLKESKKPN